jgi:putative transposase
MPRPPRIQDSGYVHHVISIGNDRQNLFSSPQDFSKYIDLIQQARLLHPVLIYNFVLMDNHVHLLLEPTQDGSLSKFMEFVSKGYAKYFNKTYGREGHVFQGRFKSFLIQEQKYFFACSRYIDLNPVKVGKAADPKDYLWSGYKALGWGGAVQLKLDRHVLYSNLGVSDGERQIVYRALVNNTPTEEIDLMEKRAGILGDREFKDKVKSNV